MITDDDGAVDDILQHESKRVKKKKRANVCVLYSEKTGVLCVAWLPTIKFSWM